MDRLGARTPAERVLRPSRSAPRGWPGGRRGGSTRRGRSGRPRSSSRRWPGGSGVGRQRAAGRPDVGAVGGLEVLDPPALAVGGQLGLAPAHPDVAASSRPRGGCCGWPTGGRPARSAGQRHDDRQPRRRARLVALLRGVPVGVDPHLGHPVERRTARRDRAAGGRRCAGQVERRARSGRARHRAGGEVVAAGLAEQRPGRVVGARSAGRSRRRRPAALGAGRCGARSAGGRRPAAAAAASRVPAAGDRRAAGVAVVVGGRGVAVGAGVGHRVHPSVRSLLDPGGLGRGGVERHLVQLVDAAAQPHGAGARRPRCRRPCAAGWWPRRCRSRRPAGPRGRAWRWPCRRRRPPWRPGRPGSPRPARPGRCSARPPG